MGETCNKHEGVDKRIQILVGKSERKGPLRKPKHRREDDPEVEFYETECEGLKPIYLAQGRNQRRILEETVTNLMAQLKYGKTDSLFAAVLTVELLLIC
jgi:hypothetical protein